MYVIQSLVENRRASIEHKVYSERLVRDSYGVLYCAIKELLYIYACAHKKHNAAQHTRVYECVRIQ